MNGVLVLDKPRGITSQSALNRVNRALNVRKSGHTGTLDPFATGVLPVCINEATKIIPYIERTWKKYDALLKLGEKTDTLDSTGVITESRDNLNFDKNAVNSVISKYVGKIKQVPPMYSAVKRKGVRLYELARRGLEIERPARNVMVYGIELIEFNPPYIRFMVECSRGTYIRALASDISDDLGCGGHLVELRRLLSDGFTMDDAVTIEEVENGNVELMDMREVLCDMPGVNVTQSIAENIRNGKQIKKSDLSGLCLPEFSKGSNIKICTGSELVAVTESVLNSEYYEEADENCLVFKLLRVIN